MTQNNGEALPDASQANAHPDGPALDGEGAMSAGLGSGRRLFGRAVSLPSRCCAFAAFDLCFHDLFNMCVWLQDGATPPSSPARSTSDSPQPVGGMLRARLVSKAAVPAAQPPPPGTPPRSPVGSPSRGVVRSPGVAVSRPFHVTSLPLPPVSCHQLPSAAAAASPPAGRPRCPKWPPASAAGSRQPVQEPWRRRRRAGTVGGSPSPR